MFSKILITHYGVNTHNGQQQTTILTGY